MGGRTGKAEPARPPHTRCGGTDAATSALGIRDPRLDEVGHGVHGVVDTGRVLATGLGEFGTSAAAPVDERGDVLDDVARLDAVRLHDIRRNHGEETRLVVDGRAEDDDTGLQLVAQAVAHLAEGGLVRHLDLRGEDLDAPDLDDVREEVAGFGAGELTTEALDLALLLADAVLQRSDAGWDLLPGDLQVTAELLDEALLAHDAVERGAAGEGLDTADAGGDGAFGRDHERPDLTGAGDVGAAAELLAEVADLDDADLFSVLLAEEGHGAALEGRLLVHDGGLDRSVDRNLVVHDAHDGLQLLGLDRLYRGEVEAEAVGRDERTGLADILAEDDAKGLVQQVGRGVVTADLLATLGIDAGVDGLADADEALLDGAAMDVEVRRGLAGIVHAESAGRGVEITGVADLAAGLAVERPAVEDDLALLASLGALGRAVRAEDGDDGAVRLGLGVAEELGARLDLRVEVGAIAALRLEGGAGAAGLALAVHGDTEAVLIDGEALLGGHLGGELQRKAVGVVETE